MDLFFDPRSKGVKAIRRRIGGSKAISNTSVSFETLEPRHYCTANDDVFTKTAADFAPSADPDKNLVTSLDVLANDTARSTNKADLFITRVTYLPPTGMGGTISRPTQAIFFQDGTFLKFLQDDAGIITGVQYGLPARELLPFDKYERQEQRVCAELTEWCDRERDNINNYYENVNLTLLRLGNFIRSELGGGAGGYGAAGSSLKDILGAVQSMKLSPIAGAALSVGGRAIDFFLASYAKNQLATLDDVLLGAFQGARDARSKELDQFGVEQIRLWEDFRLSLSKVDKRVFGNTSFVYSEDDRSPVTNPPPVPSQLGGAPINWAAASVQISSSATVAVSMSIEDYSAKLAQLMAWRNSHDFTAHRYSNVNFDEMYGDALLAFASQAGFFVTWENEQWAGRDVHTAMEPYMWQGDGAYGAGVMMYRLYAFDGHDIADELNKIKYKKR